jgi:hypothetical protein
MSETDYKELYEALLQDQRQKFRGRLRSAMLHVEKDDDSGSVLVGLELPDPVFYDCRDREKAESRLRLHLEQMAKMFMRAWGQWQEPVEE